MTRRTSPPTPCGAAGVPSAQDGPRAERWIAATDATHRAYEYVARHDGERAAGEFGELVAAFGQCPGSAEDRYRVVARYAAGVLVERDFDSGTSSYFVGHAGDYLVAVLDVGVRVQSGDTTYVNGLGMRALERAGGSAGDMRPT